MVYTITEDDYKLLAKIVKMRGLNESDTNALIEDYVRYVSWREEQILLETKKNIENQLLDFMMDMYPINSIAYVADQNDNELDMIRLYSKYGSHTIISYENDIRCTINNTDYIDIECDGFLYEYPDFLKEFFDEHCMRNDNINE